MSVFVDTSVWFAASSTRDHGNAIARAILSAEPDKITTDHVLVETCMLLRARYSRSAPNIFWGQLRDTAVKIEFVTPADLEAAWSIGQALPDQDFSVVDRTSFAVMERLGLTRAASLDSDFAIYRYGLQREKAFEIVRTGHSDTFRLFHEAILSEKQVVCTYQGKRREVCPIILGHKDGIEKALVFQFGGQSSKGITGRGDWKCFELEKVLDAEMQDGPWFAGSSHRSTQRCVDEVYIDVNTAVPNQPGRRGI